MELTPHVPELTSQDDDLGLERGDLALRKQHGGLEALCHLPARRRESLERIVVASRLPLGGDPLAPLRREPLLRRRLGAGELAAQLGELELVAVADLCSELRRRLREGERMLS